MAQDILAKRGSHYSNRAPTPNIPGAKTDAEYLPLLDNNGKNNVISTWSIADRVTYRGAYKASKIRPRVSRKDLQLRHVRFYTR